jgi:hypothetical protein
MVTSSLVRHASMVCVVALLACNDPFVPGTGVTSQGAPRFGGGGGGTGSTATTPPGLDTLPAPPPPISSPTTSPRVTVWAIADSAGTANLILGDITFNAMPNVNCFASVNPVAIPWAVVPGGVVQPAPFCLTQVVGTTAYVAFGGLAAGEFVAAIAKF